MVTLSSFRIKPNPAGKDRTAGGYASPAQLGGEWIDIRNHGTTAVNTSGVDLYHLAYPSGGGDAQYLRVTELPYCLLSPGAILRVHSGERRDISVLNSDDRAGADWHYFTGRDAYVWNNREGDAPALYMPSTRGTIDSCSYDPWPPEAEILQRQGNKLVATPVAAGTYRR